MRGVTIQVNGVVQGVGFRPAVWSLAHQLELTGSVWNGADGVTIELWGTTSQIDQFLQQLQQQPPPLAIIDQITTQSLSGAPAEGFTILESQSGHITTGVAADAATCPDCLRETQSSSNRRYRYPFTNCTHCGPRLSIIHTIPYDRPNTSMAPFAMCPTCQQEYRDPADRRFHAQPNCCPACGPQLWLEDDHGKLLDGDPILQSAELLRQGKIIAIKGIGGIHLACDATSSRAVARLRQRKQRPTKALAVMARDLQQISKHAVLSDLETETLQHQAAPIVILQQQNTALASGIAPLQQTIGFLLPYTPLHHLLMAAVERPIVLTSGNRSGEPQCIDNDQARADLSGIADYWLLHDREIINRVDDSVVRVVNGQLRVIRYGRGYAPERLSLPEGFESTPPLLAMGGALKNSFALLKEGQVTLSQYLGDLEDPYTLREYQHTHQLFHQLLDHQPQAIVVDRHPDYPPTQLGQQRADQQDLPLIEVQHHHAHIAAVMMEHQLPLNHPPLLGIALDGLGYGEDGIIWGGEFLLADYHHYRRIGHLMPVEMIGGDQANREPWRNLVAHLLKAIDLEAFLENHADLELVDYLKQKPLALLQQMVSQQINSPSVSSTGRLIDAVAAAIGIHREQLTFEGEAAIALEALAAMHPSTPGYPYRIDLQNGVAQLSWEPLWHALLSNLKEHTDSTIIAARFHQGLIDAIAEMAQLLCQQNHLKTVALGGGVFQNSLLLKGVTQRLQAAGLTTLSAARFPANDQGTAIGQCAVAAARLVQQR